MNPPSSGGNQRSFDRVPFAADLLVVHEREAWRTGLRDVSEGGCSAFRPQDCDLEEGALVRLFFVIGSGRAVGIDARVARDDARSLGFEYHDPQPVPPVSH